MAEDDTGRAGGERHLRWGQIFRMIIAAAAVGFLILFSMLNRDDVTIDYAFGEVDAPMIVVIVISAVAGFLVGAVAGRSRPRR